MNINLNNKAIRRALTIILLIVLTIPSGAAMGKYVWTGKAADFDLSIKGKYGILETGKEFNDRLFAESRYGNDLPIIFGKASDYPAVIKTSPLGNVDADHTGAIKLYRSNNKYYVLSDKVIMSNPDSRYMFKSRGGEIILDNFSTALATNMSHMFDDCRLSEINLPAEFVTSSVTDMSYMFNKARFTSFDLSGFDTSKVQNMEYMFSEASSLTSIDTSSFNTSAVTNMRYMFNECRKLTELDLSTFNTANVTDMSYMFQSCNNISSIDVSSFDTANVTKMQGMFAYMYNIAKLDLHNFSNKSCSNYYRMFYQCSKLRNVHLCGFETKKGANVSDMFREFSEYGPANALYIYVQAGMSLAETGVSHTSYAIYHTECIGPGISGSNIWDEDLKAGRAFWVCSEHSALTTNSVTGSINAPGLGFAS